MALTVRKWSLFRPSTVSCSLLVLFWWGGCLDGQDIFATIRENSPSGEIVAELMADTPIEGIHWRLNGKDADWLFLDKRNIRLNTSDDKILDREVQGPLLIAELSCYEDDTFQSVYRIVVEILNENDNSPVFTEDTVRSFMISELTPVNTLVFTVRARDADNDKIIYSIDQTSPDAEYFKVDLPNSGKVILSKPLDYETKTQLNVTIHASEMSTADHFNTSTNITINVLDGDDQYPQFVPCTLLFQGETSSVCTSPVYTANITEGEEDIMLDFSPGPIHAVDGDKGDDDGHFLMDRKTGEVKLIQGVRNRLATPELHLQVMVFQDDDPRKYSVTAVLVRVLAVNQFYPEFDKAEYHGFVTARKSHASLVETYGSKALMLHGFNPMIYFTVSPTPNHKDIYQVTREGLLIARTNELKPKQKHILEVMAVDKDSGDATSATVVIEVLSEGQSIPLSPLGDDRLTGCTVGKALFLSMVFMTVLGLILFMAMWLKKKRKGKRDPLERGCVAQGKHPNVSLRWFQLVSHRSAMPHMDEAPYKNEEYGTCNPSFSFPEKPDVSSHQDIPSCQRPVPPTMTPAPDTSFIPAQSPQSPVIFTSPTFNQTSVDGSPAHIVQEAAPPQENLSSLTGPHDTTQDSIETLSKTCPCPANLDATNTAPFTCPDSGTQTTPNDDPADPVTSPSSQSSIPCSHTRIASAEIDKPFRKSRVKTPPYSPLLSTSLSKPINTPPPTPEYEPLKAKLVHIDTSPTDTPPVTPERTSVTPSTEVDQPSTSLDQTDRSEQPGADDDSSLQDRRASTNSATTQDSLRVGDEDNNVCRGDEDADKNSEGEDELESDEEELLRVIARCNPIFITFSK
ncbi:hypothetical protein Q5P01_012400 [Channa striata]|uniref:Cadherin domain-containing protein n=1 Tax=Channa striata TaxID=64152 RepID=A0AA88SSZ3_CHASR|nr:hypothetical protein Q5P01_012400 [Channa striata]